MLDILLGLIKKIALFQMQQIQCFLTLKLSLNSWKRYLNRRMGEKKAYTTFESRDNFVCPFNVFKFII